VLFSRFWWTVSWERISARVLPTFTRTSGFLAGPITWNSLARHIWVILFTPSPSLDVQCIGYCTAGVDKRLRSTNLYHCRQCYIVLKPRSDRMDYTVVCFVTHDCSRKLRKHTTSASWVWFKLLKTFFFLFRVLTNEWMNEWMSLFRTLAAMKIAE